MWLESHGMSAPSTRHYYDHHPTNGWRKTTNARNAIVLAKRRTASVAWLARELAAAAEWLRQAFHRRVDVNDTRDGRDGDGATVWATAAATTTAQATGGSKGFRTKGFQFWVSKSSPSISRPSPESYYSSGGFRTPRGCPGLQSWGRWGLKPSPWESCHPRGGVVVTFFSPKGEKK